ncbi:leucyl aminopeptidase [Larsenimonas rhizosphaerae]|uniref:Probable cytosol aminopeptidase n=1 Tax=Larsenimonas rhizosphaerae TaxID=2944682 RepID=A0AA41ZIJ1_9GAMM|nr:leucyl aminopeptidase [Larsenimonas rhizosphaerae]MCM2129863.1 leucyl aminopeptidase [Larsenimonas rhizosphaerae]MCX2524523.1 leucyl aminopeptidase [Larsenimonas rhizosphaerae]
MDFPVLTVNPAKTETDCIIVPVFKDGPLLSATDKLDDASERLIGQLIERGDFEADPGHTQLLPFAPGLNTDRLLLVGCGTTDRMTPAVFRKALDAALAHALTLRIDNAAIAFTDIELADHDITWKAHAIAEATLYALYHFDDYKITKKTRPTLEQMQVLLSDSNQKAKAEAGLARGKAVGQGINLARQLGNLPANICTPRYLAEQAEALGRDSALNVTILDEQELENLGAGALLAVGRGSEEPSRLIIMEYRGAGNEEAPHVLVGKGITFDSGGISIKPGADMDEMKFDMCGAASVFGTMKTLLETRPAINVVGIVAAAENMPDGRAFKPGDIIKTLKGLSVEILNTDAEGRLVLCDALTYAERFNPASVIDIATLTGACIVALGDHAAGLLSNDDDIALDLLEAGEQAWDRAWHLPLWDEYQSQLDSHYADLANIGGKKAGTITAACFLSRFTDNYPWAHLDIAGVAWNGKKGATGRPVGLLSQYLFNRAEEIAQFNEE